MAAPKPEKLARPTHLASLSPDQTVAALLRLTMEISVLRDRLSAQEALLVSHGILQPGAIDAHQPDSDESARRAAARARLIEQLLSDLAGD